MRKEDFVIGLEFFCAEKKWRCTDVGTRVVVGICISDHLSDPSWLNGPPFAVAESVFDENDFAACSLPQEDEGF